MQGTEASLFIGAKSLPKLAVTGMLTLTTNIVLLKDGKLRFC